MVKNDINYKGIFYLVLNMVDSMITNFVLKSGGGELNPVYNIIMANGFNVFETKLMILFPLIVIWKVILEQNSQIALKLLNIGLLVMKTLVLIELIGIVYIYV